MFETRECLHCGRTFLPQAEHQVYCLPCLNPNNDKVKEVIRKSSIADNRPPAKIIVGETYGTLKILERINRNKFKVQCTKCGNVYTRYIQSFAALQKASFCRNCKAEYSPHLYRVWQTMCAKLDYSDIDPAFWTWEGFEAWVHTGSNYNEATGFIHFYRIGAGEPFGPRNCAFTRTRVPLLHDVSIANLTRPQEFVMDSKLEGQATDFLEF